ncbi:TPA: hypothetical protein EYP84_05750, partial [Candidatus Bipolaricaulota bacterium]|nr:hypothetical protein [Candidatus Bipolaricaulota bacterium]
LTAEAKYKLLNQVANGGGLVMAFMSRGLDRYFKRLLELPRDDDGARFITTGIPFGGLPAWQRFKSSEEAARKLVTVARLRNGRIVILNFGSWSANTFIIPPCPPEHVDYYMMLVAKAVVWAAGKLPPVAIRTIGIANAQGKLVGEIDRTALPHAKATLTIILTRRISTRYIAVTWRVRDITGAVHLQKSVRVKWRNGEIRSSLPLMRLPEGTYFVDAIVKIDGKCANWCSAPLTVTSHPTIAELQVTPKALHPNDAVQVVAKFTEPPQKPMRMRFQVHDNFGRLLDERFVDVGSFAQVTCKLSTDGVLTNSVRISAALMDDDEIASAKTLTIPVDLPLPRDDFSFLFWGGAGDVYVWRYVTRTLFELGVDTSNIGGVASLARDNIRALPYITRIYARGVEGKPPVRVPCLTDPQYRANEIAKLRDRATAAAPFGTTGYTLGDENFLAGRDDVCFSETCKAHFRKYLRSIYGSLERLNAEWGTNYRAWDDVAPITLNEARKAGRFAQWADHRMHMESVFAEVHELFANAIRKVDRDARVGFDGAFGTDSWHGYDWWKLSRIMDVWNVYPDPVQVELVRSFQRPNTYSGFWFGGYIRYAPGQRYEAFERWAPWYALLHGMNSAWWFKAFSNARELCQEDAIAADLRIMPAVRWTAEEVRELKGGIAKLLLKCAREHCGIAILYSQACVHASTIDGSLGGHVRSQRGIMHIIEHIGLQYDFISDAQVAAGLLARAGERTPSEFVTAQRATVPRYRVVILPCAHALSDEVRRQLIAFVRNGGIVIADVRPGVMDGHCKPIDEAQWQSLFGVKFAPSADARDGQSMTIARGLMGERIELQFERVLVDGGVKLTDGEALGDANGVPAMIVKRNGDGCAILLNASFAGYNAESQDGVMWRKLLRHLLEFARVGAWATTEIRRGEDAYLRGDAVQYRDGAYRYIAMLLRPEPPNIKVTVRVRLPEARWVYDMRRGKCIGRRREFNVTVTNGRAKAFALLPVRIRSVAVIAPKRIRRGDELAIAVRVVGAPDGARHVVRIEVTSPSGELIRHYRANVEVRGGERGMHRMRVALNDAVGAWTITAHDIATGAKGSAKVMVIR